MARNIRIRYSLPTARANGRLLTSGEIRGVRVSLSADGGANFAFLALVPPTATSYLQTELEAGTWVFRLVVEDTDGQLSSAVDVSAEILAAPGPVTGVTATIE